MPYSKPADAPDYVPKPKRAQWIAVFNSEWDRHADAEPAERERRAFAAANAVAGPSAQNKYAKLMAKVSKDDAEKFLHKLIAVMQDEFPAFLSDLRAALEVAMLSGVGDGLLELDVNDAELIRSANTAAQDYASERAAEMIGMKYDAEGNLIPNPDARWAISDTTRDKIREIVTEAFSGDSAMPDIKKSIESALRDGAEDGGIFSPERAELIAETEVMRAQAGGHFTTWKASGIIKSIKWLTSEDEKVCELCDGNDEQTVEIGKPFRSGDVFPGAHPRCRCVVVVAETN